MYEQQKSIPYSAICRCPSSSGSDVKSLLQSLIARKQQCYLLLLFTDQVRYLTIISILSQIIGKCTHIPAVYVPLWPVSGYNHWHVEVVTRKVFRHRKVTDPAISYLSENTRVFNTSEYAEKRPLGRRDNCNMIMRWNTFSFRVETPLLDKRKLGYIKSGNLIIETGQQE